VSDGDEGRHVVGTGSPAGPDDAPDGDERAPAGDVVQAVADFVDDLVEEVRPADPV
jgi:hypothetical protein